MIKQIVSLFRKSNLYSVRPEAKEADYPAPETFEHPPYIGKLAVLSYYVPEDLMHPDDAERYLDGHMKGELIFKCIQEEDSWVTVANSQGEKFRVNPKRILWVPEPEYVIGQKVETTNGTHRVGRICLRAWHFKEKCFTYFIEIESKNNKKTIHKRRYWASDLRAIMVNK